MTSTEASRRSEEKVETEKTLHTAVGFVIMYENDVATSGVKDASLRLQCYVVRMGDFVRRIINHLCCLRDHTHLWNSYSVHIINSSFESYTIVMEGVRNRIHTEKAACSE